MEIKQITDKNFASIWDEFVKNNSTPASFLQSWQWGNFRAEKLGESIFRWAIFENEELIAVAQFVKRALPGGRFYLNCAKGPIFRKEKGERRKEVIKLLISKIKALAKQEKLVFWRIAPPYDKNFQFPIRLGSSESRWFPNLQFIRPKILKHLKEPENTLLLDLKQSEDDLLQQMNQKTRYNIRLAEKKGVIIKRPVSTRSIRGRQETRDPSRLARSEAGKRQVDIFYNLITETAKRDKINVLNKNYYENLLQLPGVELFTAEYENQILATIIVLGFGNTATYFYGASSNEQRNLMPNHLLQWQAIKWARGQGYEWYDFWGISDNNKGWQGITKFKKGFGGQEINSIGTWDYVLNKKWYNLYRIVKPINKLLKIFK